MTDKQTPPDWVLIEAAKRSEWSVRDVRALRAYYRDTAAYRALCDMIERYEARPVDRKLLCAREATREWAETMATGAVEIAIRAIELWEEGFGK